MGASGVAEIDFGAFPGGTHATVDITGQSGIGTGSRVEAWIEPAATTDHSSDEHLLAVALGLTAVAADRVAGVGFTIHGLYNPPINEPLTAPTPSKFRSVAGTVYGYTAPSEGGYSKRLYGKFKVGWVWV